MFYLCIMEEAKAILISILKDQIQALMEKDMGKIIFRDIQGQAPDTQIDLSNLQAITDRYNLIKLIHDYEVSI